jgi:purine-cytosine permease-like protein
MSMHGLIFYIVEFIVILMGVVLIHKFVYNRKREYDMGSLYLSVLGATYIWIVTVCIHEFGIETGFIGGLIGGGIAVALLDSATGFLHNSGY